MCKGKQFSRMEKVILVLQSSLSIATLWQNIVNSELYLLTHCIGWFPIAAITNDHKLTGLSKHIYYLTVLEARSWNWVSLG